MTDVMEKMRRTNPTLATDPDNQPGSHAQALLESITSQNRLTRPRRRRWVNVGIAVAASVLLGCALVAQPLFGGGSGVAVASTPALLVYSSEQPLAAQLRAQKLAAAVGRLTEPERANTYTRTAGWYYNMTEGEGNTLDPQSIERWITPDGEVIARHQDGSVTDGSSMWNGKEAPTDPGALLKFLSIGHPIEEMGTGELEVAIADYYRESNPTPTQRAALIRLFGSAPGVVSYGNVVDRAGREGVAFSIDTPMSGAPERRTLIFDSATGYLLSEEEVAFALTNDGPRLPEPRVTAYTLFYPPTADLPTRP